MNIYIYKFDYEYFSLTLCKLQVKMLMSTNDVNECRMMLKKHY